MGLVKDRRFDRFLERFDAHIARMDVHMAETRAAIREAAIRNERALQTFEARLHLLEDEFRDSRAERRAHIDALQRLLDRWGEGPTPAS